MPTTLISANELRTYFEINDDIGDGRLTPHIGAASRRVKAWVGVEAYTDALSDSTVDPLRQADLKFAEATLAMHFAVPGLNTTITPKGVVKTAREGGTTGTILTYLSPNEIGQLSQIYLDQAEEIARPYMLSDGTPAAGVVVVED